MSAASSPSITHSEELLEVSVNEKTIRIPAHFIDVTIRDCELRLAAIADGGKIGNAAIVSTVLHGGAMSIPWTPDADRPQMQVATALGEFLGDPKNRMHGILNVGDQVDPSGAGGKDGWGDSKEEPGKTRIPGPTASETFHLDRDYIIQPYLAICLHMYFSFGNHCHNFWKYGVSDFGIGERKGFAFVEWIRQISILPSAGEPEKPGLCLLDGRHGKALPKFYCPHPYYVIRFHLLEGKQVHIVVIDSSLLGQDPFQLLWLKAMVEQSRDTPNLSGLILMTHHSIPGTSNRRASSKDEAVKKYGFPRGLLSDAIGKARTEGREADATRYKLLLQLYETAGMEPSFSGNIHDILYRSFQLVGVSLSDFTLVLHGHDHWQQLRYVLCKTTEGMVYLPVVGVGSGGSPGESNSIEFAAPGLTYAGACEPGTHPDLCNPFGFTTIKLSDKGIDVSFYGVRRGTLEPVLIASYGCNPKEGIFSWAPPEKGLSISDTLIQANRFLLNALLVPFETGKLSLFRCCFSMLTRYQEEIEAVQGKLEELFHLNPLPEVSESASAQDSFHLSSEEQFKRLTDMHEKIVEILAIYVSVPKTKGGFAHFLGLAEIVLRGMVEAIIEHQYQSRGAGAPDSWSDSHTSYYLFQAVKRVRTWLGLSASDIRYSFISEAKGLTEADHSLLRSLLVPFEVGSLWLVNCCIAMSDEFQEADEGVRKQLEGFFRLNPLTTNSEGTRYRSVIRHYLYPTDQLIQFLNSLYLVIVGILDRYLSNPRHQGKLAHFLGLIEIAFRSVRLAMIGHQADLCFLKMGERKPDPWLIIPLHYLFCAAQEVERFFPGMPMLATPLTDPSREDKLRRACCVVSVAYRQRELKGISGGLAVLKEDGPLATELLGVCRSIFLTILSVGCQDPVLVVRALMCSDSTELKMAVVQELTDSRSPRYPAIPPETISPKAISAYQKTVYTTTTRQIPAQTALEDLCRAFFRPDSFGPLTSWFVEPLIARVFAVSELRYQIQTAVLPADQIPPEPVLGGTGSAPPDARRAAPA